MTIATYPITQDSTLDKDFSVDTFPKAQNLSNFLFSWLIGKEIRSDEVYFDKSSSLPISIHGDVGFSIEIRENESISNSFELMYFDHFTAIPKNISKIKVKTIYKGKAEIHFNLEEFEY